MGNDKQYRMNEMTNAVFYMNISFWLFLLLFYILMPPFLHKFHEWRTLLLLLAVVLFILYCAVRYYILLLYFGDSKKALRRQLLENGSTFLGLILLFISEGFVFAHTSIISTSSYRSLLYTLALLCFIGPTIYTNLMANIKLLEMKKNSKVD